MIDLLEFSFHFRDVFLRVRRLLFAVLLSLLCAICSFLSTSCRLSFLLSLDNLLDLNLHLMFSFFDFLRCNRPGFFSDLYLFAAPSFVCHALFQLGIFLFLNFNFLFNLDLVCSCFLSNVQFLLGCKMLMTFRILVLVIGLSSFFETLFSSHVSACSWHCSFCSLYSHLLLGVLFSPAVECALLSLCSAE